MKKNKSIIFLAALTLLFLITAYWYLRPKEPDNKNNSEEIIRTADSLVNKDEPEFQKAFKYMDSCLLKEGELIDDINFRQKYDRLKTITTIK